MRIQIRAYDNSDYELILQLIKSEGKEWEEYLKPEYQINLAKSITYVAYFGNQLIGYSRSMSDNGFFIWVIDLLVHRNKRGDNVGKRLLECIRRNNPDQDVFIMSDVDEYYTKLGYMKEGSIFKMK